MDATNALAQSCDVYFYQVGERLGVDRLAKYAEACGLGSPTGIDLDREARGLVPTKGWKLNRLGVPWQGGETLSVVIGQGFNLVTPIQMLGLISAVANGGIRHKPLVIRRIEFPGGLPVKTQAPVSLGTLPASENTLRIVKIGLMDAVKKPPGIARIAGADVAGKTGTAQVVRMADNDEDEPVESKLLRHRDHGWFIAFAPAEKPRVAVAVLIEHGGHGSTAAGPIAREMIRTYLKVN